VTIFLAVAEAPGLFTGFALSASLAAAIFAGAVAGRGALGALAVITAFSQHSLI
jgi:hypothetical protein